MLTVTLHLIYFTQESAGLMSVSHPWCEASMMDRMAKDDRRCVSCRKVAAKSEFWRVVRSHPSNQVAIDLGDKCLQGRSVYLCPTLECLHLAQKKNRLGRSLKAAVGEDIYQALGARLWTLTQSE